jgi:hypothetical protein
MGLSGKQPGLLIAVIVPALLSTIVAIARSLSKVKRRPSYISKTGALAAEILLVAAVVDLPVVTPASVTSWHGDQISGWISEVFVIISIHYGFGTHQAEILAKPNVMQDLVNAAFWQTTGYCE